MSFTRRAVAVVAAHLIVAAISAGATTTAADLAASLAHSSAYRNGTLAVAFVDAASGQLLAGVAETKSVVPASCMKTISTAACLHHLGPNHRFVTTLETTAPLANGILAGNLVIRGGGDPTLGSDRVDGSLPYQKLIDSATKQVADAGMRKIAGSVVGDESFLPWDPIPDGWEWSDIGNYYGAGTSGLCFNDNLYHVIFQSGAKVGDAAAIIKTDPPTPEIEWSNAMHTGPAGSGDNGYIYGVPGTTQRWTRGTIPLGEPFTIKGSLPDPALTAARLLTQSLRAAGIEVTGEPHSMREMSAGGEGAHAIATFQSPTLAAIQLKLNKQSFNLYAEMMLMHTARTAGDGTRASGIKAQEAYLKELGAPLEGFHITDGSGLSRSNAVTAEGMARLMAALSRTPHFAVWKATLPVLGVDGDLRNRETSSPLRGKVSAKTGLINRVRGLCGYLETKSGRTVTFGLFANDYSKPWKQVDTDFDALLRAVYDEY